MPQDTIQNPILRGFNPDPSIVRVGDDYYIATSTFEWYPGRADPPLARPGQLAAC
jgi:xylan 1,4-beta-xylosidase